MADLVRRMDFYSAMLKGGDFSPSALAVAFCLLYRHLNGHTGRCDPSVPTLAEEAGLTERGVNKAIAELRKSEWWAVTRGGGRGRRNCYLPQFQTLNRSSCIGVGKDEPLFTVSGAETLNSKVINPEPPFTRTSKNHEEEYMHARRRSRGRVGAAFDKEGADAFESFWRAYPSRHPHSNPKKPAREKFLAALKRGADPEAIVRGAENYRASIERDGTDQRFVAQAKTWLNEERWDEYQNAPELPRLRAGMN
jgi:hypothetical protein